MQLVATGLLSKEVGPALGISVQTVKNHLTSAYAKLGVGSHTQAFVALGWLRAGDTQLDMDRLQVIDLRKELHQLGLEADAIAARYQGVAE